MILAKPDKTLDECEPEELDEWSEFVNLFMNCHTCVDFEMIYYSPDYNYCPICFVEQGVNGFTHKDVKLLIN